MPADRHIGIVEITAAAILVVILGWLIVIGQSLLMPILIGIMSVYILTATADAMARWPVVGHLSQRMRRTLAAVLILCVLVVIVGFIAGNTAAISAALPGYSENLKGLIAEVSKLIGLDQVPTLDSLLSQAQSRINMQSLVTGVVSGLTSTGTFIFTALLYAAFLLSDWDDMPAKTRRALGDEAQAEATLAIMRRINGRIGSYLSAKTLINVILALISFGVMLVLGIEFAAFWAILIGLLNYIPYIGSILGVLFPVALSLVQFPNVTPAVIAFVGLMGAQIFVGNVLEPRMLGRSVNMSPFILLIALAFWMTVWGVIGAILAVPLTSMIMIILAEIPQTRPIAVMMSGDGDV